MLRTCLDPRVTSRLIRNYTGSAQSVRMSSPFTQAVVSSMRLLYPEVLADKSFDNTGLLLEAPFIPGRKNRNSVLLAIDLTRAVVDEVIDNKHSVVVAYHPIIFRGLKSITTADSQQNSLLRLAAYGISVYCPHTAVDIVPDGMGDWLAGVVAGRNLFPFRAHTTKVVNPSPQSSIDTANAVTKSTPYNITNTGAGRLVTFEEPQPLLGLIRNVAILMGTEQIPIAIPQNASIDSIKIKTVGVCPGSGSNVLRNCSPQPDLIVTGEMSHHETLAIIERGGCVVTLFHSNSERGFLQARMKKELEEQVRTQWWKLRKEMRAEGGNLDDGIAEMLDDETVDIVVSQRDRDPFEILTL